MKNTFGLLILNIKKTAPNFKKRVHFVFLSDLMYLFWYIEVPGTSSFLYTIKGMLFFFSVQVTIVLLWNAMIATLFELKTKEVCLLKTEEFNIESNGTMNKWCTSYRNCLPLQSTCPGLVGFVLLHLKCVVFCRLLYVVVFSDIFPLWSWWCSFFFDWWFLIVPFVIIRKRGAFLLIYICKNHRKTRKSACIFEWWWVKWPSYSFIFLVQAAFSKFLAVA